MEFFTTASSHYFEKNTRQLIAAFAKHSKFELKVYSEDMVPSKGTHHQVGTLRRMDQIESFQREFKARFHERYKFFYYFQWMDIWVLKIAAQLQHLEETSSEYSVFIDSDCVLTNSRFDETVKQFLSPFMVSGKDIAFFRRFGTHLHTESGFLVLRKCPELVKAYSEMLEFILDGYFYNLASWTDCSVIDHFADTGRINFFDFCAHYDLKSTNPVYESPLRKSMLHLKGPRKGVYSIIKRILGLYR